VGKQVGTTKHAPCTHMSATEQMAHNLSTPYRGMSVIKFSKIMDSHGVFLGCHQSRSI